MRNLVLLGFLAGSTQAAVAEPKPFECRWAGAAITIDGMADEEAWDRAEVIDRFTLPWLGENERPARTGTKARLLWNRDNLYFLAEMEDADLYAFSKEHDETLWLGDVFELFFKPSDEHGGYYEFQVNPSAAVLDMFIPRRGAGTFERFAKDRPFHVVANVTADGTVGDWTDRDTGWTVEGRIPWTDFLATGGRPDVDEQWRFALCRYDYSVDFEGPELSTCAPLKKSRPDFHHFENYALLRFVGPSKETAARPFGIEKLEPLKTSRVVGSPEPPPPFRVVPTLPELTIDWPIQVVREPGTRNLIVADEDKPWGKSRLLRTDGTSEPVVLLSVTDTIYDFCFHPKFETNGFVFVGSNGAREGEEKMSRVTRYTVDRDAPHGIDATSAKVIIEWESDGHNGAAVAFGNDGMLYVTSGDGTSDSDTNVKGQGLDHLLAKLLRIDVDRPANDGSPYTVPADNPFVGRKGARPETFAYGFRNPWRLTVDRATGDIWVGNNGQDLWEQIYRVERGANYGWSVYEGSHPFYLEREVGPTPVSKPTLEHPHSEARSLTGGVVYSGTKFPELRGAYLYGDYSTGKIWGAKHDGERVVWHRELADTTLQITGFAHDADGELLIVDHRDGGGFFTFARNDAPDYDPADFPRKLSETGLFEKGGHVPKPGLIPYSVNSPLWSDGADKQRFIALPHDAGPDGGPPRIGFDPKKSWDFPDRTVLVKSFGFDVVDGDEAEHRWVETRLMLKQQGEWVGFSYAWNDEQTDAVLVEQEGRDERFRVRTDEGEVREQTWRYPSRTECMVCHSRAAKYVLGLSTPQMNRDHDYDGRVDNQLRVLEHLGLFEGDWKQSAVRRLQEELERDVDAKTAKRDVARMSKTRDQRAAARSRLLPLPPDEYDRLPNPYDDAEPLEARVRSYLHANCAHCHVKSGGGNAAMELGFATKTEKAGLLDVKPLHDRYGIDDARLVAPGEPERSLLLHRIATTERGRMPQLATSIPDHRAVDLVTKWIESLAIDE